MAVETKPVDRSFMTNLIPGHLVFLEKPGHLALPGSSTAPLGSVIDQHGTTSIQEDENLISGVVPVGSRENRAKEEEEEGKEHQGSKKAQGPPP